jgi:16S rRNA (guanine527-N7)-methyltransferase
MSLPPPILPFEHFAEELARWSPESLKRGALEALFCHYRELMRWNRTLALVGPGTPEDILGRHYGESLAALPLVSPQATNGVDIGSGAGFPGQILSAVRPNLHFTLTEARERKWSFLQTATRKASLPCLCLNVRVAAPLPEGLPERIDLVTTRAWRLESEILAALATRLGSSGRMLLWVGKDDPDLPPQLSLGRSLRLPGSERRRILELKPATAP